MATWDQIVNRLASLFALAGAVDHAEPYPGPSPTFGRTAVVYPGSAQLDSVGGLETTTFRIPVHVLLEQQPARAATIAGAEAMIAQVRDLLRVHIGACGAGTDVRLDQAMVDVVRYNADRYAAALFDLVVTDRIPRTYRAGTSLVAPPTAGAGIIWAIQTVAALLAPAVTPAIIQVISQPGPAMTGWPCAVLYPGLSNETYGLDTLEAQAFAVTADVLFEREPGRPATVQHALQTAEAMRTVVRDHVGAAGGDSALRLMGMEVKRTRYGGDSYIGLRCTYTLEAWLDVPARALGATLAPE